MNEQKIEIPSPTFDQKFKAFEIAMNMIAKPVFSKPADKASVHEELGMYFHNCREVAGVILLAASNVAVPEPSD